MARALGYARLFSAAIVLAVWSVVRACDVHGAFWSALFLAVLSAAVVVSELERIRLRKSGRAIP